MTQPTPRRSVLQDWVQQLTMMQQSVLLTAVRGPDGLPKYHPVKYLLRWYRRCILLSSFQHRVLDNPIVSDGGSFLGPSLALEEIGLREPTVAELVDLSSSAYWHDAMNDKATDYLRSVDEIPHHFQMHLLHAAEIVGYKHPNAQIRYWWHQFYARLVHDLHLFPESEEQMEARLGDTREGWLARGDVATND